MGVTASFIYAVALGAFTLAGVRHGLVRRTVIIVIIASLVFVHGLLGMWSGMTPAHRVFAALFASASTAEERLAQEHRARLARAAAGALDRTAVGDLLDELWRADWPRGSHTGRGLSRHDVAESVLGPECASWAGFGSRSSPAWTGAAREEAAAFAARWIAEPDAARAADWWMPTVHLLAADPGWAAVDADLLDRAAVRLAERWAIGPPTGARPPAYSRPVRGSLGVNRLLAQLVLSGKLSPDAATQTLALLNAAGFEPEVKLRTPDEPRSASRWYRVIARPASIGSELPLTHAVRTDAVWLDWSGVPNAGPSGAAPPEPPPPGRYTVGVHARMVLPREALRDVLLFAPPDLRHSHEPFDLDAWPERLEFEVRGAAELVVPAPAATGRRP
mgnify:CR=1 FL=1